VKKVLCLFAHPNARQSRSNRLIIERIKDLPNVMVDDLYEKYPEWNIDKEVEQELLRAADVLFIQQPIYWYGMPALLKLWVDTVFDMGFAYGPGGTALQGKTMQLSFTTGSPKDAYTSQGIHRYPLESFLLPYTQTAELCGMKWRAPLVLYGSPTEDSDRLETHAELVRARLVEICSHSGENSH
jgi:glutathione-regulated potassium-efflux system ancillary protein KefF